MLAFGGSMASLSERACVLSAVLLLEAAALSGTQVLNMCVCVCVAVEQDMSKIRFIRRSRRVVAGV